MRRGETSQGKWFMYVSGVSIKDQGLQTCKYAKIFQTCREDLIEKKIKMHHLSLSSEFVRKTS